MERKEVIKEIYDAEEIKITTICMGRTTEEDTVIKVKIADEGDDEIIIYGEDRETRYLIGDISYDEEMGYAFTFGNNITYVEI